MAKRNAKKQATRAELEAEDPVCRRLALLLDESDLLILTQGADYDTDDELGAEYDKRLAYLPVLLSELMDYRVTCLLAADKKPFVPGLDEPVNIRDRKPLSPEDPTAHEGSTDAADDASETDAK